MKSLRITNSILLLLLFLFFAKPANSQTAVPPNSEDTPIKVSTYLVNIPVIASDRAGRYVPGLKKENFSITQDGVKRDIEFFADEKAPMNIAILIDTSYSTRIVLADIQSAARDFVKVFRPEDKGMIVTFDSALRILQDLTADQKKLSKAIGNADVLTGGGSNMQDSIYVIVKRDFAEVKGRKAIIVLTDGMVAGKAISNQKLLSSLADSDILVYPIIFNTDDFFPKSDPPKDMKLPNGKIVSGEEIKRRLEENNRGRMEFMSLLGTVTGGRLLASKSNDFKKSFQSIADELKNQYLIGFYPQNVDDGKPHKVAVQVDSKDIAIRTKRNISLKTSGQENQ